VKQCLGDGLRSDLTTGREGNNYRHNNKYIYKIKKLPLTLDQELILITAATAKNIVLNAFNFGFFQ
jgi:hypothetical protein